MYKIKYRSPDEMKDSYVEWLRRIPKDWNIKRLKYISECIPSNVDKKSKPGEKPVKLCNYTDVYYNDYINGSIHFMDATATRTEIIKFGLKEGDIILTKDSESPDDIGIASYVKERVNNLVCGYHLIIIKSNKRSSSLYLYFHLLCKGIRNYFEINANGGVFPIKQTVQS